MWLSYFFVVILKKIALVDLNDIERLEIFNLQKLAVESGPILDETQGGDIAFDHGVIIFENQSLK